jgi:hypothetical protein
MNPLPRFRLAQLPELLRSGVRYSSTKATPSTGPSKGYAIPEGHGEQIWVYTHRKSEQIIYSFENRLNVCANSSILRPKLMPLSSLTMT